MALTACSGSGGGERSSATTVAGPVETTAAPGTPTTVAPEVTIPGSPRAATTVPSGLGPGEARMTGTVTGPDGPVNGAVVRVERYVGQSKSSTEVRSVNGSWTLDGILGGAYRVQAFRAPDLAQGEARALFLGATETVNVELTLARYGDNSLTVTVEPNPPAVGVSTLLTVTAADAEVDSQGQVVTSGRAGSRLQLVVSSGVVLETSAATVTDATGKAYWRFQCVAAGAFSASLLVSGSGVPLSLPPCVAGRGSGG